MTDLDMSHELISWKLYDDCIEAISFCEVSVSSATNTGRGNVRV